MMVALKGYVLVLTIVNNSWAWNENTGITTIFKTKKDCEIIRKIMIDKDKNAIPWQLITCVRR